MQLSIVGNLDLSSRLARVISTQGDATRAVPLARFTSAMWESFNHGERVQVSGSLVRDALEVRAIMRIN